MSFWFSSPAWGLACSHYGLLVTLEECAYAILTQLLTRGLHAKSFCANKSVASCDPSLVTFIPNRLEHVANTLLDVPKGGPTSRTGMGLLPHLPV